TSAETVALHSSETLGFVQTDLHSTVLVQLAWQVVETLHDGGVVLVSHLGAVYATLQPPLQSTLAPQLAVASAISLQSPVHLPWHWPLQKVPWHGVESHMPVQSAMHLPVQSAFASTVPSQVAFAMQVPEHPPVISPGVHDVGTSGGVHIVLAEHVDSHMAWTVVSTVQCPPEMTRLQPASAVSVPLILTDAW